MSAVFSLCRSYRYLLEREVAPTGDLFQQHKGDVVSFCMLNPSKAAEDGIEDPTSRKIQGFAQRLGFRRVRIVNLYAWVSTDPGLLKTVKDPVGPDNDRYIVEGTAGGPVICGWGKNAEPARARHVLGLLNAAGRETFALQLNGDGTPQHPLYIGYDRTPIPFGGP